MTDEEYNEILEEAYSRMRSWQGGIRGQMTRKEDGLDYWVAVVTVERYRPSSTETVLLQDYASMSRRLEEMASIVKSAFFEGYMARAGDPSSEWKGSNAKIMMDAIRQSSAPLTTNLPKSSGNEGISDG